jgi:peptidoglycan/LPS O-acetylase OafA/YrhL
MREIVSHTSLRGLASLGVVIYHLRWNLPANVSPDRVTDFFAHAYTLVDLFFILSGFVMSFVYARFLETQPTTKQLRSFFVARFARIYPLHIATLVFIVLLSALEVRLCDDASCRWNLDVPDLLRNILLIHAWGTADGFGFNFPSWSVSAEAMAYLLFPVFAVYWRKRLPLGALAALLVAVYVTLSANFEHLDLGARLDFIRGPTGFLLGMLIFHYRNVTAALSPRIVSAVQVLAAAAIVAIMHFGLNDFLLIPAFALLVVSTWQDRGTVSRGLCTPWLKHLGDWSFAMYLLHIPVRNVANHLWPKVASSIPAGWNEWGFVIAVTVITVAASAFVYRWFECPARDKLRETLAGRRRNDLAAAAPAAGRADGH